MLRGKIVIGDFPTRSVLRTLHQVYGVPLACMVLHRANSHIEMRNGVIVLSWDLLISLLRSVLLLPTLLEMTTMR
jgi:hypothetical protein